MREAVAPARFDAQELTACDREKAAELKQFWHDKPEEQMDRVSAALEAGKMAVKAA